MCSVCRHHYYIFMVCFLLRFFFYLLATAAVPRCRRRHLLHHHSYNIVFLIVTYGVPMLVMVVCYTIMGKVLWGSQSIGEHTQRQIESIKAKKKVWDLPYKLNYLWSFKMLHTWVVNIRWRPFIIKSLHYRFTFVFLCLSFYLFISVQCLRLLLLFFSCQKFEARHNTVIKTLHLHRHIPLIKWF